MGLRICYFAVGAIAAAIAAGHARAEDKVIKIGGLLPMSGPGSYFGAQDKQGIELALDEINRVGVAGYKFEVAENWSRPQCADRYESRNFSIEGQLSAHTMPHRPRVITSARGSTR